MIFSQERGSASSSLQTMESEGSTGLWSPSLRLPPQSPRLINNCQRSRWHVLFSKVCGGSLEAARDLSSWPSALRPQPRPSLQRICHKRYAANDMTRFVRSKEPRRRRNGSSITSQIGYHCAQGGAHPYQPPVVCVHLCSFALVCAHVPACGRPKRSNIIRGSCLSGHLQCNCAAPKEVLLSQALPHQGIPPELIIPGLLDTLFGLLTLWFSFGPLTIGLRQGWWRLLVGWTVWEKTAMTWSTD